MKKKQHTKNALALPRLLFAVALIALGTALAAFTVTAEVRVPRKKGKPFDAITPAPAAAVASDAASADLPWTVFPVPNGKATQTNNAVGSVACSSDNDCWAVGSYADGTVEQTLIEHWDGNAWGVFPSPNVAPSTDNELHDVACASATDCWAVGRVTASGVDQTLIEHWDGTAWTIVPSPDTSATQNNVLNSVTCVSSSDCWAVGESLSTNNRWQTLAQHWDGVSWSIVPSANGLVPNQHNYLASVICVSSSDCWAVGRYSNGLSIQTLTERWNGVAWTVVVSPNTDPTRENLLAGVSCVTSSDCWAVGSSWSGSANQTLAEHWDGSSWEMVASANTSAAQNNSLNDVFCVSSSECEAVGTYLQGSVYRTFIQRWTGAGWAISSSPNEGNQTNSLNGIFCSSTQCWAVGYRVENGVFQTLFQRWNGTTWQIIPSSDIGGAQTENGISDLTCVSRTDCWAVGSYYPFGSTGSTPPQTLIEHWDGVSWEIVASPNSDAAHRNELSGVTCASAADCWAVGVQHASTNLSTPAQTLTLHWNGNDWSIIASPNTSTTRSNFLSHVTCAGLGDCWAVGYALVPGDYETLIMHWNGAAWALVASPNQPPGHNELSNVVCLLSSDCWAIGSYYHDTALGITAQTLVQHWDGTSWSIRPSPNTDDLEHNYLTGISCSSSSDCWAAGRYVTTSNFLPLLEHWNGTAWERVNAPNPGTSENHYFLDVACASSAECWAVGYFDNGSANRTMVARWDGSLWSIISSDNTAPLQSNSLAAIACAAADDCWAAGHFQANHEQNLMLRHFIPPLPVIRSIAKEGSTVRIALESYSSCTYQLERSTTLTPASSFTALGEPKLGLTGTMIEFTDAGAPNETAFYRVKQTR